LPPSRTDARATAIIWLLRSFPGKCASRRGLSAFSRCPDMSPLRKVQPEQPEAFAASERPAHLVTATISLMATGSGWKRKLVR
jgi:hypothetical protein